MPEPRFPKRFRTVVDAAVGMKKHPRLRHTVPDRHFQDGYRGMTALPIGAQRPSHDLPVKHNGQVYPASEGTQLRDGVPSVRRHPFLTARFGREHLAQDVADCQSDTYRQPVP